MGRHKGSKNKITTIKTDIFESIAPSIEVTEKKIKTLAICELCGAEIKCSPVNLNLTYLTGKGEFHRNCKDRLHICDKCANELSDVIDKFITSKNKKLNRFNMEG